jgi:hypothetical protein
MHAGERVHKMGRDIKENGWKKSFKKFQSPKLSDLRDLRDDEKNIYLISPLRQYAAKSTDVEIQT